MCGMMGCINNSDISRTRRKKQPVVFLPGNTSKPCKPSGQLSSFGYLAFVLSLLNGVVNAANNINNNQNNNNNNNNDNNNNNNNINIANNNNNQNNNNMVGDITFGRQFCSRVFFRWSPGES